MPIPDALLRRLPPEVRRGFEAYDHSLSRMLGLWLDRRPWQRARNRLRIRADRLRQAGDHPAAITAYREYLAVRPDHALAWAMLGHCQRAAGQRAEAGQSYARAAGLAPSDPFIISAAARFLHEDGETAAAVALLERAMATGGGHRLRSALILLREPGGQPASDAAPGDATLFLDVTDVLEFLLQRRAVSGIQRVMLALMAHALANPEALCCVLTRPWDSRLWALPRAPLHRLLELAAAAQCGGPAASQLIGEIFATARLLGPRAGATLFRVGGFWGDGRNPPLSASLRRAGMRNARLIYDLIPARHPEFCRADHAQDVIAALAEDMPSVDQLLTISRYTADDVAAWFAEQGLPAPAIVPVPLAREAGATPGAWPRRLKAMRGQAFVLSVGTVEARKNQALLVRIWARLPNPPMLVLAGKRGGPIGDFDTAMRQTAAAGGRVLHLEDLSDHDIAALYDACLFTAFPSLAEGWGLPVGESLAHGKLCVAARGSSLVEVGGDQALYFDPADEAGAAALFTRLIGDAAWRAGLEADLREKFQPRGWTEVAREMVAALQAAPAPAPREWAGPELPPGTLWRPGAAEDPGAPPLRPMLAEGWLRPTPRGVSPQGASAPLVFHCRVPGRLRLRFAGAAERMIDLQAGAHRLRCDATLVELAFALPLPTPVDKPDQPPRWS